MRQSPRTRLGRRSQTEVVHEAGEVVVDLEDEEVSEVDVVEAAAEDFNRTEGLRP